MSDVEHVHVWAELGEHKERCECGRRRLKPVPGLYDGEYTEDLRGLWLGYGTLRIVVEGPGAIAGTVAARAEHDPAIRQEDLPIRTLHRNYRLLAGPDD